MCKALNEGDLGTLAYLVMENYSQESTQVSWHSGAQDQLIRTLTILRKLVVT